MRNVSRLARTLVPAAALAVLMALAACSADPTVAPTPPPPSATAPVVSPTATPVPPISTTIPPVSTPTTAPRPAPTPTTAPRPEPTSTPVPPPPEPKGPTLPASIVDIHGNEVIVDDISRIVVLNGDITEVVFALELGGNVLRSTPVRPTPQRRRSSRKSDTKGLSAPKASSRWDRP